jgi:hypothetical protein
MIRCRACGKFAREDNVCTVCGKPPENVFGLGYQMQRWDDTQRYLWCVVVEMGVRNTDKYLETVWNR